MPKIHFRKIRNLHFSQKFQMQRYFFELIGWILTSEFEDVFTDSLDQPVRELWPIITSKATMVASVEVKVLEQLFISVQSEYMKLRFCFPQPALTEVLETICVNHGFPICMNARRVFYSLVLTCRLIFLQL